MAHENGDKQRPTKRQHVQGMLDETDPLTVAIKVLCCGLSLLNFDIVIPTHIVALSTAMERRLHKNDINHVYVHFCANGVVVIVL